MQLHGLAPTVPHPPTGESPALAACRRAAELEGIVKESVPGAVFVINPDKVGRSAIRHLRIPWWVVYVCRPSPPHQQPHPGPSWCQPTTAASLLAPSRGPCSHARAPLRCGAREWCMSRCRCASLRLSPLLPAVLAPSRAGQPGSCCAASLLSLRLPDRLGPCSSPPSHPSLYLRPPLPQAMPRPFAKLRNLDLEALAAKVAADLK